MSSSDRRTFLLGLAALPLASCGFTPAYGPAGGASKLRGTIAVPTPGTREEFAFTARIESRLGRPQAPTYDLGYSFAFARESGGITSTNATTRYTLKGTVTFTLTDRATGTRVAGGRARGFTSWSATATTVAGLAAEDDAARRLAVILADQVINRLIAAAPSLP